LISLGILLIPIYLCYRYTPAVTNPEFLYQSNDIITIIISFNLKTFGAAAARCLPLTHARLRAPALTLSPTVALL
jgi:hypothetical protein